MREEASQEERAIGGFNFLSHFFGFLYICMYFLGLFVRFA